MSGWAIISLGNRFRGDDSVGPYVLHRLRQQLEPAVSCIENGGDMAQLLEDWKGRKICLIDAVMTDTHASGEIVRVDGLAQSMPESLCGTSSHGLNLAEALQLGNSLNALPQQLNIFGICGENFAFSADLSPPVKRAAAQVEMEILQQFLGHTGGPQCTNTH